MMSPVRRALIIAATALAGAIAASEAAADRPAGNTFSWGQELRQQKLPGWRPNRNPVSPKRWTALTNANLLTAGQNGLWFSGSAALPFDLPIRDTEPIAEWFTRANYRRLHRLTGIKFDVNWELRVAQLAKDRKLHRAWNIRNRIPARRYLMFGPGWQATAKREIRRIVPRHRNFAFANYYTGVDEPMAFPPTGPAERSALGRRVLQDVQAQYGWPAPSGNLGPSTDPVEGLKWLAWNRYSGQRYFAARKELADLIHRLDPAGLVSPNSYAFIDGFIPWDYTQLAAFADVVELDPYVSYDEAKNPGRGRYNHGFGTKLMSDLTGKRVRTIVQAFPYQGYDPTAADVWTWSSQALRAGGTDLSLYGETNPRFTRPLVYRAMLDIANTMRTARLPAPPVDPATLVVYATASEAQGQPGIPFAERPRSRADALYTTYAALGELAGSAFTFDADTRLTSDRSRLAGARTVWLPRADTLDRPFADALVAWVRAGGTLIVTDPDAFTRAPDGSPLAEIRAALIGASLDPAQRSAPISVATNAFASTIPSRTLTVPTQVSSSRAFGPLPADATAVGTYPDGSVAILRRSVGAGQVVAFAGQVMFPATLDSPGGLVDLAGGLARWRGSSVGLPVWRYELPGHPEPGRLPWRTAISPGYAP
jgi:hypothetical protein